MTAWIVFAVGGVITYLSRGSFLFLGDRLRLPDWTDAPLRYVAPAAFAAIAVPATLGDDGLRALLPPTAAVIGVVAASVVVARTRSVPWGLLVGLLAYSGVALLTG